MYLSFLVNDGENTTLNLTTRQPVVSKRFLTNTAAITPSIKPFQTKMYVRQQVTACGSNTAVA